MTKFGLTLRSLRKSLGYNQTDFGKILGLSTQAVSDLEREVNSPSKTLIEYLKFRYPEIFKEQTENVTPEMVASLIKPTANAGVLPSANESQLSVGARLKKIRIEWGCNIEEMAQKLAVGPATYLCYEEGEQDIPSSVLTALLKKGVDLVWLLEGVVGEAPQKVVGFDAVLSEHFEIVKKFKNKALAKEITESLLILEKENPVLLEEVNDYIDLKLRRIGKSPKQSGVVAGKKKSVS